MTNPAAQCWVFLLFAMKRFASVLVLTLFISPCGEGQTMTREYEVKGLDIVGNEEINDDILRANIQTRETPGWFWKFMYGISETLGDKPEYFDPFVFQADLSRLRQFYVDQGFFQSRVDTSIQFFAERKEARLAFRIQEGQRSYIDTLSYRGFENLPSILLEDIHGSPLLREKDPYVVQNVENELRRIVGAFVNHGYVRVKLDTVIARRYASTNNVAIQFVFVPNERYRFGEIHVDQDTTVEEKVDPAVVLRHLDFVPGDFYGESKKVDSERNLNRLGIFDASRIEPVVTSAPSLDVPMRVFVRPRPFHELTPEIGVNDENNAFNIVTGIGYSNRNFFGGARNFSTHLRINLQSIQDLNFGRILDTGLQDSSLIGRIELSGQITQPYLFSNKVSLTASVAAILDKQKPYFAPIYRGRLAVTAQQARYTRIIGEFNLERVDPTGFTDRGKTIVAEREDLTRQFNSIFTITIMRDKRNDLFSPTSGFYHSASIEEAGFVSALLSGTPDGSSELQKVDLPYSQYYKLTGVGQWYWDGGNDQRFIWAARVRGGFAKLYGKRQIVGDDTVLVPVPITRRFYGGGSGSVRGWKSRELGAVPFPNEGGNAQFEASLEGRWHLFKDAGRFWFINLPSISLVMFYDVGNIWTDLKRVRAREIAMAAGFGFRWDTIAGPIRIDLGFRVYDPFDQSGRNWIIDRRFFHDTYSIVHFGIGHAF